MQATGKHCGLPRALHMRITQWLEDHNRLYGDFRRLAAEPSEEAFMVFEATNRRFRWSSKNVGLNGVGSGRTETFWEIAQWPQRCVG